MTTPRAILEPDRPYLTDGGLETTLVFHDEIDLPDFAAFPLLDTPEGRSTLQRYFAPYLEIARRDGATFVIDTPTWRANPDWAARLGYDRAALARVNVAAVDFVRSLAAAARVDHLVDGVIGPRGDGYAVGEAMSAEESASYHSLQARAFAEAGAGFITAVTMTNVEEAIGICEAGARVGLPVCISFTVETDGRLPSGTSLAEAIALVDASPNPPAHYMVNCAHPSHFEHVLDDGAWRDRIKAVRANASRMSHVELDNAEELDAGDPEELATDYVRLGTLLPGLQLVGGCCGTDHRHIDRISATLVPC
ncbi:MAG: homocysteine S-methyltransferase family protein [Acidimicrobiales bacterium]